MGSQFKGYIIGVLAAALYGMNPLFALPLYSEGMNTDSVLLIRYAIAIPIIGLMCVFRGRTLRVDFRQLMVLIALGWSWASRRSDCFSVTGIWMPE